VKLARKLSLALILGTLAVLVAHAAIRVQRELTLFESDMQRDARVMGRALGSAVAELWQTEGPESARALIQKVDVRQSDILIWWVPLDGSGHDPARPAPSHGENQQLANGQVVSRHIHLQGKGDHLVTFVPVIIDTRPGGALAFAESLASEEAYVRRTILNTALATLAVAFICGLVATVAGVWFVGRPMKSLIAQARRVGAGDFSKRITLRQNDEIGQLAREMNVMCDHLAEANDRAAKESNARIAAIEQLRHADRLATVGKLASGIAHELGAPLQVISGRARMLVDGDVPAEEIPDDARTILEQAQRMTKIIRQLLDFARQRSAEKEPLDLRPIVDATCAMLETLARKRGASLSAQVGDEEVIALIDAEQIRQALTNLVLNGVQAVKEGGRVHVGLRVERARPPADHGGPETECACLCVKDDGVGMSKDLMAHIFEPFFTTKRVGEGTGLGLSVTYGIVREHGGWIDVQSEPGAGSQFCIYLPLGERA
jgi:signal transduction histidine kinase